MSLSNPNKVITEERLNEYHQTILPYLGGMPDVLANKFSRADLYSTDEKMIGRWIDGKPVYQKVFTFNSQLNVSYNSWTQTDISITGNNIERIISCIGFPGTYTSMYPLLASCSSDFNNVALQTPRNGVADDVKQIILKYTKTTDSPVEIGLDTDYSTTEKIVGTWIDGKPIYQKTIDLGVLPNATTKSVNHGILNLDKVISSNGCAKGSDLQIPLPHVQTTSTTTQVRVDITPTVIEIITEYNFSTYNGYITIQYTKTTD